MTLNNKFSKKEKLKNKKRLAELFLRGKSITIYPIKVFYLQRKLNTALPIYVGVSVPKKNIKLAVNRNLLKRRMKEAYRLNNHGLKKDLQKHQKGLDLMLIYISKQILPYQQIEDKIKVTLTRLTDLSEVAAK